MYIIINHISNYKESLMCKIILKFKNKGRAKEHSIKPLRQIMLYAFGNV